MKSPRIAPPWGRVAKLSDGSRIGLVLVLCAVSVLGGSWLARRRSPGPLLSFQAADPEASCGPVSLAVASYWCRSPATIERLNALCRVGESGTTSLLDLQKAATALGLEAKAVRLETPRPLPWKLPMILHLNGDHFVPALPIDDHKMVLVDLPGEPKVWDARSLAGDWRGVALLLSPSSAEMAAALKSAGFLKE